MKKWISGWLIFFLVFLLRNAVAQPAKEPAPNTVIFLLLKMTKDSITGTDSLMLVEKIKSSGQIKRLPAEAPGLTRLPYLNLVFCKGNTPVDSVRYSYPLRERIQNTRENTQGYKDIEIRSREFFFRFQLGKADLLEIYKTGVGEQKKLLSIDLR